MEDRFVWTCSDSTGYTLERLHIFQIPWTSAQLEISLSLEGVTSHSNEEVIKTSPHRCGSIKTFWA